RRRAWLRRSAVLALLALAAAVPFALHAKAPAVDNGDRIRTAILGTADLAVPDDVVLAQDLERAIELRRRENFDRMLDARDPGELVEHATLSEQALDRRTLGIDSLFVVGDELFGYLFRPENGWGSGSPDRKSPNYTPHLRRIQQGATGGPDAFGCFSCHSKGGPDGAGTQTQNAFMRGDGVRTAGADQRNPPSVIGLGPIACLAREMSADLRAQMEAARQRAQTEGHEIEQPLVTKTVSFGHVTADPAATPNYAALQAIDQHLPLHPF